MSTQAPKFAATDIPANARIAIAAARFNADIVDPLLSGCLDRLKQLGVAGPRVEVHHVPGAFELPLAAQTLARTKRFAATRPTSITSPANARGGLQTSALPNRCPSFSAS